MESLPLMLGSRMGSWGHAVAVLLSTSVAITIDTVGAWGPRFTLCVQCVILGCMPPRLGGKAAVVTHLVRQNNACPVLCVRVWSVSSPVSCQPKHTCTSQEGRLEGQLGLCVGGCVVFLGLHMYRWLSWCCQPPVCLQGRLGGASLVAPARVCRCCSTAL